MMFHGHTVGRRESPTHKTWSAMLDRCTNPRCKCFARYGGRGISVCERWKTFVHFLADMGPRPAGKSLDRIDNNGNYEPGNCRWATLIEQNNNKRTVAKIEIDGERMSPADWSRKTGVCGATIKYRLRHGETGADLVRPPKRKLTQEERALVLSSPMSTVKLGRLLGVYPSTISRVRSGGQGQGRRS